MWLTISHMSLNCNYPISALSSYILHININNSFIYFTDLHAARSYVQGIELKRFIFIYQLGLEAQSMDFEFIP